MVEKTLNRPVSIKSRGRPAVLRVVDCRKRETQFAPAPFSFLSNAVGITDGSYLLGEATDLPLTGDWIDVHRRLTDTFYLKCNLGGSGFDSDVFVRSGFEAATTDLPIAGSWGQCAGVMRQATRQFDRLVADRGIVTLSPAFFALLDQPRSIGLTCACLTTDAIAQQARKKKVIPGTCRKNQVRSCNSIAVQTSNSNETDAAIRRNPDTAKGRI